MDSVKAVDSVNVEKKKIDKDINELIDTELKNDAPSNSSIPGCAPSPTFKLPILFASVPTKPTITDSPGTAPPDLSWTTILPSPPTVAAVTDDVIILAVIAFKFNVEAVPVIAVTAAADPSLPINISSKDKFPEIATFVARVAPVIAPLDDAADVIDARPVVPTASLIVFKPVPAKFKIPLPALSPLIRP